MEVNARFAQYMLPDGGRGLPYGTQYRPLGPNPSSEVTTTTPPLGRATTGGGGAEE